MSKPSNYSTDQHTKTLLAMVHAPYNRTKNIQSYFDEFLNLVKTANIKYEDALSIKLRDIDNAYFFTKGKLAEIREVCEAHNIKQVIISDQLTPQQARNLEDYLECELMDRTVETVERVAAWLRRKNGITAQFRYCNPIADRGALLAIAEEKVRHRLSTYDRDRR